ncbi:MAG: acyl-CoA dehydrogenase family protein, partial [Betaproteobacteria bacterium]
MNKPMDFTPVNAGRYDTHDVRNQAAAASGFDAFTGDVVLKAALLREAPWAVSRCAAVGALVGDPDVQEAARLANRHTPELRTHDRFVHRIDWVDFHPAWHQLMTLAYRHGATRLDFAVGSAELMRQALTLALIHTTTRRGLGAPLCEQPMMAGVLADLAPEVEAATLLALRVPKATDHLDDDDGERAFARIATPIAKYSTARGAGDRADSARACRSGRRVCGNAARTSGRSRGCAVRRVREFVHEGARGSDRRTRASAVRLVSCPVNSLDSSRRNRPP